MSPQRSPGIGDKVGWRHESSMEISCSHLSGIGSLMWVCSNLGARLPGTSAHRCAKSVRLPWRGHLRSWPTVRRAATHSATSCASAGAGDGADPRPTGADLMPARAVRRWPDDPTARSGTHELVTADKQTVLNWWSDEHVVATDGTHSIQRAQFGKAVFATRSSSPRGGLIVILVGAAVGFCFQHSQGFAVELAKAALTLGSGLILEAR